MVVLFQCLPASLHYRLKTNWTITIYMCALTAAMIRLHLI